MRSAAAEEAAAEEGAKPAGANFGVPHRDFTCLQSLRKADGAHKHRRWFWLTVGEDGLQIWVRWSANEDMSAAWQWKSFRSAPPKQRRVAAMRRRPKAGATWG